MFVLGVFFEFISQGIRGGRGTPPTTHRILAQPTKTYFKKTKKNNTALRKKKTNYEKPRTIEINLAKHHVGVIPLMFV